MSTSPQPVQATAPLRDLILDLRGMTSSGSPEERMVQAVKDRLVRLLGSPGWLPEECHVGDPRGYARHLVYREEGGGFCVVGMVWGPGQKTAIHDHAGVWCVEGVYEGQIEVTRFDLQGEVGDRVRFSPGPAIRAGVGACGALIPPVEYHQIANPGDTTAITLHIYGRDLEVCHVFHPLGGELYERKLKRMQYHSVIPLAL
jgi:3-mercaptopropionate dioxygenase